MVLGINRRHNNSAVHLYPTKKRLVAGLKLAGYCTVVIISCFTAFAFSKLRANLKRNWKICSNQPLSPTNKKSTTVYQKTVAKNASFETKENVMAILDQEKLKEIYDNRENFKGTDGSRKLYNYVNGLVDIDGNPNSDIEIPLVNYKNYFENLLKIKNQDGKIYVSLQGTSMEQSLDIKDPMTVLFPLDNFLEEAENIQLFEDLPLKHQVYIATTADENSNTMSKDQQNELMNEEKVLQQLLPNDQLKFFNTCMTQAINQNAAVRGFIHFRNSDPSLGRPIERIYIKMNKDYAHQLVDKLITNFYRGASDGVLDIKVACPQVAGRSDGIVIYIGDSEGGKKIDETAKQKANDNRENILEKLKLIQEEYPYFFKDNLPLKKSEAPGIATIPGLSTSDSFTKNLCNAICNTLADSETNEENFKEKITEAYVIKLKL